jgi:hypothetical protein
MEDAENMETMGKKYLKSTFLRDFVRVRIKSSPSAVLLLCFLNVASLGQIGCLTWSTLHRRFSSVQDFTIFLDTEHNWTRVIKLLILKDFTNWRSQGNL